MPSFKIRENGDVILKEDLRVRNKGRKEQGVGFTTVTALHPTKAYINRAIDDIDTTVIKTMNREASGVRAGAG